MLITSIVALFLNMNPSINVYMICWLIACALNYCFIMRGSRWRQLLVAHPMAPISTVKLYTLFMMMVLLMLLIVLFPIGGKDWHSLFG